MLYEVITHGYQSFTPGEATPDAAHEIGIRLAKELWGGRFQVIVATHLDKENHIHNHFVITSYSIHYTKLYDGQKPILRFAGADRAGL